MGVTSPPAGRDVGEGMADTQSLVGRLASGEVILGDGSYIMTLEKRGYATAGSWTPEAAAEHPEAIEQLGIEFARAGLYHPDVHLLGSRRCPSQRLQVYVCRNQPSSMRHCQESGSGKGDHCCGRDHPDWHLQSGLLGQVQGPE